VALLFGALAVPIARLLQIPTATPVLIVAVALLPMTVKVIVVGALQGMQKFNALGVIHMTQAVLRLGLGLLLVNLGLDAAGALAAVPAGTTGVVLLGLVLIGGFVWQRASVPHAVSTADLARSVAMTLVGMVSFAVLTNMDALIVKHYFAPSEAGRYSMVVTLGKIVIFMPAAFAQVLFPKSARRHAQQRDSSRLLRLSLLATLLPCAGLTILCWTLPGVLLKLVFGVKNTFQGPVLGLVALAMSGYALVNVWINYFLSVKQTGFMPILLVAVLVQFGLLALFHASLLQVAIVIAATATGILAAAEIWFRVRANTQVILSVNP
jgi:O-antigen/teichoic acid export membrane protein